MQPKPDVPQNEDQERIATTSWLNERFKAGASVWQDEILIRTRGLEKPIVVDLNETLVSSFMPYVVNPDANEALNLARKVGNVVIVCSGLDWELQQEELERLNLWHDDVVLMTANNYVPPEMDSSHSLNGDVVMDGHWRFPDETPAYDKAVAEFIEFAKIRDLSCSEGDFRELALYKRVSPIFLKPYDIPIIDDYFLATRDNPGMKGFSVNNWRVYGTEAGRKDLAETGKQYVGVLEAVKQVEQYYKEIESVNPS